MKPAHRFQLLIPAVLATIFAAHHANAAVLLATGSLSALGGDLALQTSGALENGIAGNALGGLGYRAGLCCCVL